MPPTTNTRIHLAQHPDEAPAVIATISGADSALARAILTLKMFRPLAPDSMVLARIDREEPHYASQAATLLRAAAFPVEITPDLQQEIDTEWSWANYPMEWLSREEVRRVGAEAQKIHDNIASGRLVIHHHAHDGWTTVAVGTYLGGESVHLHGENHLRMVSLTYGDPQEAIAEFHRLYTDAVRPGPAPTTTTEQSAARALHGTAPAAPAAPDSGGHSAPKEETPEAVDGPEAVEDELVPVYVAGPGDHEQLLADFFAVHDDWQKYRPYDETTIAVHEDLTLRVEFVHQTNPGDIKWTVAAYASPLGERLWHATATTQTPMQLVDSLLSAVAWHSDHAVTETPPTEKVITATVQSLLDEGWKHTVDGHGLSWGPSDDAPAGLRFEVFSARFRPTGSPAWTIWGGSTFDQPAWAIHLSSATPQSILQELTSELAEGQVRRTPTPQQQPPAPALQALPPRGVRNAPGSSQPVNGPGPYSPPKKRSTYF